MRKIYKTFLFLILAQIVIAQNDYSYLIEELGITDESDFEDLSELMSEDLRKGVFNLNFVGDANVQNSLNSGSDFTANTGIGLVMDRFWLGSSNKFRQFNLSLSINVASTADTIIAEIGSNGEVLNERDFGSFLLIPNSSKQSASISGSVYFNDFGKDAKKITKFISGFNFHITGSNSNWKLDSANIDLAALSLNFGFFHEFIPDKVRFNDGYSITIGVNYSSRYILGDLNFKPLEDSKMKLLNTNNSSFHGIEFKSKFRFRNIVAEVTIPLLGGGEVPGLTRSQFVTSIGFVGGFPLKLTKTNSNQVGNNSLGI